MAKSECFVFQGGSCQDGNGEFIPSLGVSNFFFTGSFVNSTAYEFNSFGLQHHLINCVDPVLLSVLRAVLALLILSTFFTLVAFVLDIIGPKRKYLMIIRRNGMLNISSVFLLVTVCGLCYWAALLLYENLHAYKRAKGSKVIVNFGISYYIIVCSAVANILATACNLLRKYPPTFPEPDTQPILTETDQMILGEETPAPPPTAVREPPPYAP